MAEHDPMRRNLLRGAAAAASFAAVSRADELSDIQAQSKQLREQSQALTKRLADIEKRQQKLEQQPAIKAQAEVLQINPADAMAAAQHRTNRARRLRVKCMTPSTTSGQIT